MQNVKTISIEDIVISDLNPRENFDPKYINSLAKSIKRDGLWNPIIVRKKIEGYHLISGECRIRAFKKLKRRKIKSIILEVDDDEAKLLAVKTNIMRMDMNPIEEGNGLLKLVESGWDVDLIAKEINKSKSWVYSRLRLAKESSDGLKKAIINNNIPFSYSIKIIELNEGLQGPVIEKIIKDRLNHNEVIILVDLLKNNDNLDEIAKILKSSWDELFLKEQFKRLMLNRTNNNGDDISIIDCKCNVKYIVDWDKHKIISKEHIN